MNKNLSFVLSEEQFKALSEIADQRYSGKLSAAIRESLASTYPTVRDAKKVAPFGAPKGKRVR